MTRIAKATGIGITVGILGVIAGLSPIGLQVEEMLGLDLLFHFRGSRAAPPEVAIITIDKPSADQLGFDPEPDRWPRSIHAKLVEQLLQMGARVIAFDMLFEETRSPDDDALFGKAIERAGNVVLVESLRVEKVPLTDQVPTNVNIESLISPIEPLAKAAAAMGPFPLPKIPVKISQYWTFKTSAGDLPTFPVVTFQLFASELHEELVNLIEEAGVDFPTDFPNTTNKLLASGGVEKAMRTLRLMGRKSPDTFREVIDRLNQSEQLRQNPGKATQFRELIDLYQGKDSRYLDFYGPPATVPTYSYHRVLDARQEDPSDSIPMDFQGKAVFIGLSERLRLEQKDGFYTVFSQKNGIDISGVEIAATAFANLLEGRSVRPLTKKMYVAVLLLWGIFSGIIIFLLPGAYAILAIICSGTAYFLFIQHQFEATGCWYPMVVPFMLQLPVACLGSLMLKYRTVEEERANIKKAFGYYLPDEVVTRLAGDTAHLTSGSRVVYGTCLYSDAEQYTRIAERMSPEDLSRYMNRYYEILFEPIRNRGGIISDVVGDAMLAIWATAKNEIHYRNQACMAALEVAQSMNRPVATLKSQVLPTRMGLHAGEMQLGSIGAMDHFEYRAVGEVVSTSTRIEGLNKYLRTKLLLSKEVLAGLTNFQTRRMGFFLMSGKSKPVEIFELMGKQDESDDNVRTLCAFFQQGVEAFQLRRWQKAKTFFREAIRIAGQDGPSSFYVHQCEIMEANPPEDDWEGVIRLDKK
jgi:adenylate cyclase